MTCYRGTARKGQETTMTNKQKIAAGIVLISIPIIAGCCETLLWLAVALTAIDAAIVSTGILDTIGGVDDD